MKWLLYPILFLLALVAVLAILTRFAPASVIDIVNRLQSQASIDADSPAVRFIPLSLNLQGLTVAGTGFDIESKALAIDADLSAWLRGEPFWSLAGDELIVTTSPTATAPEPAGQDGPSPLDLSPLFGIESLTIKSLQVADQTLAVAARNADGAFTAEVAGTIGDVKLRLGHAHPHALNLDAALAGDISLAADGQLATQQELQLNLEDLELRTPDLGASEVSGSITCAHALDQCTLRGLSAQIEVPGNEPIDVTLDGEVSSTGDLYAASLEGHVDALSVSASVEMLAADAGAFELELQAETWPAFLPTALYQPSQLAPFSAQAKGTAETGKVTLSSAQVRTPSHDTTLAAALTFAPAIAVDTTIRAKRIYVPLTGEPPTHAPAQPPADTGATGPLLSDEALDWSWLADLTAHVDITADTLELQSAAFTDFSVQAHAADGEIALTALDGRLGEGGFSGNGSLAQQAEGVRATLHFELSKVALEAFGFVPTEELTGGLTEVYVDLSTSGASPKDMGANATGEIYLIVEDAMLQNDLIEIVGSDLVMQALEKLNPFVKDDPTTELACALVRFKVADGVLESKDELVMETGKMEISGSGNANLLTEGLKITFTPTAKSGVGINAGSLVSFLAVGGTIREPGLTVDALGTLKTGATVGAALSTGGASLIAEGLLKRAMNAGSACEAFRQRRETGSEG